MTAASPRPLPQHAGAPLAALLCFTISACSSAPVRDPAPQTKPLATEAPAPRLDPIAEGSSFQTIASKRFDLSLPLPEGFQVDDRTESWLVAKHPTTSSTLLVRTWREYELMNRQTCEERARLFRPLPERESGMVVEERRIDVPPEHDTIVQVRVRVGAGETEGSVLAFGGSVRRCFAFVFTTRDAHTKTVVARLSTIRHGTLARMSFESDLVPKRKPPNLTGQ